MTQKINLMGKSYGRLVVIGETTKTDKSRQSFWVCLCECGAKKEIGGRSLRRGDIVSCGCFAKEQRAKANTKHGQYQSLTYSSWDNMIQRCTNTAHQSYKNYGQRGIVVCERWHNFNNFFEDMGNRTSTLHSIDRINNDLGYFKENCRWATASEQARNKRLSRFNSSGATGVSFNNNEKKWRAYIWTGNKQHHLGYFGNKSDAINARQQAEKNLWTQDLLA
jgi:hypothetical protein